MKRNALAALLLALAACGAEAPSKEAAINTAHHHARDLYEYEGDIGKLPPKVEDLGDRWRIHFLLPPGSTGPAPIVDLRKSDLGIVESYRSAEVRPSAAERGER
jgi:hypothetical protein